MKYELSINQTPRSKLDQYKFLYRQKEVTIYITDGYVRITAERKTKYTIPQIASGKVELFSQATKNAMLLHYLRYSKSLIVQQLCVQKGSKKIIFTQDSPDFSKIYTLGADQLSPPFLSKWDNNVVLEEIISYTKGTQDSRYSALIALICAKSTSYAAEKFIHLWMSFNGMYSYFSKLVANKCKKKKERICEHEKLRQILISQEIGREHLCSNHITAIGFNTTKILKNFDTELIDREYLSNNPKGQELAKLLIEMIEGTLSRQYLTTAYGYLLVDYAYYFRCNLIHADKPLPLFCYESDHEIKCLQMVNRLLEEYITENLPLWFDPEYIRGTLIPLADTIL